MMNLSIKRSIFVFLLFAIASLQAFAEREITGVVKDDKGNPASYATVQVKGTTIGTETDENGVYTLTVPDDATQLEISLGTDVVEATIGKDAKQPDASFKPAEDLTVVTVQDVNIGLGQTISVKDLTTSVAGVRGDELAKSPVNNVAEALAGKMAGVSVRTTEGSPDAEVQLNVRGTSSITQGTEPLYIVDGMPVASISDIPASVIESVDVLKDAAATAIYGSRGANGVIIVTTKEVRTTKDKDGKPIESCNKISVDYAGSVGWKWLAKELDVLNDEEYALWEYERALILDKGLATGSETKNYNSYFKYDPSAGNIFDFVKNTYAGSGIDWQDELFANTGTTWNNSITITGGSKTLNYNLNYSRLNDNSILEGSNYVKNYLQTKINAQPFTAKDGRNFKLGMTARYSSTKTVGSVVNDAGSESSKGESLFKRAYLYSPIPSYMYAGSLEDGLGSADIADISALTDPLTYINDNYKEVTKKAYSYSGFLSWTVIKGLTLRTEGGYDARVGDTYRYYGPTSYKSRDTGGKKPIVSFNTEMSDRFRNMNTISFDKKKWKKDHNFNVLLGEEMVITNYHNLETYVDNLPAEFTYDNAKNFTGAGNAVLVDNNYPISDHLLSFFGRANYNFKGKYLFSASLRADGSSKFKDENAWGYFPSLSGAWRISEERFMSGAKKSWLYDLKIRASYGTSGNNDIPAGAFTDYRVPYIDSKGKKSWKAGLTYDGVEVIANPDLKWETTTTRDIGVDFGLFKNRLSGTIDLYWNSVSDMLIALQNSAGKYKFENLGSVSNKGVEFTINGAILSNKDYSLTANFNIAYNKNEVDSLGVKELQVVSGAANKAVDFIVVPGSALGQVWGYVLAGRYEVSDFEPNLVNGKWKLLNSENQLLKDNAIPGAIKFEDIDGDGKITDADQQVIGNTIPKITGGFNLSGQYKNFDLSANFAFVYDVDVYNGDLLELTQNQGSNRFRNISSTLKSGERFTYIDSDPASATYGKYIGDNPTRLAEMNANTTEYLPVLSGKGEYFMHSGMLEDGSFIRLSTLTLGYTMPNKLVRKIYLNNVRFYVSGTNLFCLTKYSGMDPESSTRRKNPLSPGVDWSAYPKSRAVTVGLNVTF